MAEISPVAIHEGRVPGQSAHRLAWVLMVLIISAALPVAVEAQETPERVFTLRFSLDDESLEKARVPAGATTQVSLSLLGEASLGTSETLTVNFAYDPQDGGVTVASPDPVHFTEGSTIAELTLSAASGAQSGTLTASIGSTMNTMIAPASLAVGIVPPRMFSLAFSSSFEESRRPVTSIPDNTGSVRNVIEVLFDGVITSLSVSVSITHTYRSELRVTLISPSGQEVVLRDSLFNDDIQDLRETWDTVSLPTLADLLEASSIGDWTLTVSDHGRGDTGTLDEWSLRMKIAPLAMTRMPAGAAAQVQLSLLGEASLGEDETLTVDLGYTTEVDGVNGGVLISPPGPIHFTADNTVVDLTLGATRTAISGTLTTTVSGLEGVVVAPVSLPVEIVLREFTLAFTTLDGAPLEMVQVQAGTMTQVRLSLSGTRSLNEDETLTVDLDASRIDGVMISQEQIHFTADNTVVDLTLSAMRTAMSGTLTTTVVNQVEGVVVVPTSLPVEIVPREFTLAFTALDGELLEMVQVQAGTMTQVRLSLLGETSLREDETLTVDLDASQVDGVMISREQIHFTTVNTVVDLTLNATRTAISGILTAMVSSQEEGTVVAPASLPVEIVPREFALAFMTLDGEPLEMVQVQAGTMARARLSLSGEVSLDEDEVLMVDFDASRIDGVMISSPRQIHFTAVNTVADLTLNVTAAAMLSTLTTVSSLDGAVVAPASLRVEILPREFALSFMTLDGEPLEMVQVQASATTRVRLSLSGDGSLGEDEMLTVSFAYAAEDGSTDADVAARESVSFTTTSGTLIDLTLSVPGAAQPGTLTASIENALNAVTTPTSLQVEVLPREFTLAFVPREIAVVPLDVYTWAVMLTLDNAEQLEAGEPVPVTLTLPESSNLTVFPADLVFGRDTDTHVVDLAVPPGAPTGSETLRATVPDSHGLLNAGFIPADVQVNVVGSREFTWTFRSVETGARLSRIVIEAGSSRTVLLSHDGAQGAVLSEGESITPWLRLASRGGAGITLEPSHLTFTSVAPTHSLTFRAAPTAISGHLAADVERLVRPATFSGWAVFPVDIVPREFSLAFTTLDDQPLSTTRVQAGAMTRVRLSLSSDGSLGEDEMLAVSFVYAAENGSTGADVTVSTPTEVAFTADNTTVDLTVSVPVEAMTGVLTASGVGMVNVETEPASLSVEVVPREFSLAFTTLDDQPLPATRVRAGATTQVRLSLSGSAPLGADETLMIEVAYDPPDGGVSVASPAQVRFVEGTTMVDLTLNTTVAAQSGTLTATIENVVNAVIPPTSLQVEIVPREFTLTFETRSGTPLPTVEVTRTDPLVQARLRLSGDVPLVGVETLPVSFVYEIEGGSTGNDVTVQEEPVIFTAESGSTIDLTFAASLPTRPGTLTAIIESAVISTPASVQVMVGRAVISMNVLSRTGQLRTSETISMPAGSSTEVMVTLGEAALLDDDESVEVDFIAQTVSVSPPRLTLTRASPRGLLTITATHAAAPLSGVVNNSTAIAMVDGVIRPDALSVAASGIQEGVTDLITVEILPREFALAFTTLSGDSLEMARMQAGTTATVRLTLSGDDSLGEDEMLLVSFVYAAENGSTDADVMVQESSVVFAAGRSSSADVTLSATAATAQSGTLTASIAGTGSLMVSPAHLPVEITLDVIVSREFALTFTTLGDAPLETARVQAGATTQVRLALSGAGSLGEDETLTVRFVYEPATAGMGGDVTVPAPVVFEQSSTAVDLTLSAVAQAQPGTLTASIAGTLSLMVSPAQLPVEIMPREFALAFTALDGEPLTTVRMQAGTTTRVSLSLLGEAPLGADETLTARLIYEAESEGMDADVAVQQLVSFSTVIDLTLTAPIAAQPGTLTARVESAVNAVAPPTSLQVEILPREFALMFTTSDDEPLETARVRAGATTRVRLNLLGEAPLGADETLTARLIYEAEGGGTGADVAVQQLVSFSTVSGTAIDLTLTAPIAAQPGALTARVESAVNAVTTPTSLQVEILPREFALEFTTLSGESLETARVRADATTRVRLSLLGEASLGMDETLTVRLVYEAEGGGMVGAGVAVQQLVDFNTVNGTVIDLTLTASIAAQPGTLMARVESAVNAVTAPASLQVEILPREFALEFTTLSGESLETARVQAGATTQVRLNLLGKAPLGEDETLTAHLIYEAEGGGMGADVAVQQLVNFNTVDGTVIGLTLIAPVAAQPGRLTARVESAVNAIITPTSLQVEILPRRFALAFTALSGESPVTAQVQAGATTQVSLSLLGEAPLGADETLMVSFGYEQAGGVAVSSPMTAAFGENVLTVVLTLNATAAAQPGRLTASIEDAVNAIITPTSLQVEILPRRFALAFTSLSGESPVTARVQAGAVTQVRLNLLGEASLGADEALMVSFGYRPQAGGVAVSSPMTAAFGESTPTVVLTLNATAAAQPGRLTARVESAVNAIIAPTSLQVEILPREFALAFITLSGEPLETTRTRVRASAATQVRLSLLGEAPLGADEMLMVSFGYEPQAGGVAVSSPMMAAFGESTPTVVLTLNATALAQPGTLTASIEDAVNAIITPTSLQVEILPREFALAFTLPEVGIVPGSTRAVTLTLENAARLEAGEQVPVVLTLSEGSSLTLSSTEFTFGRDIDTHVVSLSVPAGATSGSETLRATVLDSHGLVNVDFAPATIPVNVIDSRDFAWAFRSVETREALSTAVVVAGGSLEILLSFEGDQGALLAEDEFVEVSLSLMNSTGIMVMPPALTFTSTAPMRSLTLQAESTATTLGRLMVTLTGTTPVSLPDATVAPTAELPVAVVREFTLTFTTPEDEALTRVRVPANGTTRVSLNLLGASPLSESETLGVHFTYEPRDGGVAVSSPMEVVFSENSRTVGLTLSAAVDAREGTLTVSASSTLPDTLPITPADLPVEILPREFALAFTTLDDASLEMVRVPAGATTRVRLSLLGDDPLGEDEMLTVSFVYASENGGTGADVTVQESVSFTTTSNVIDLTLNVPVAARPGMLTAVIEDAVNVIITPASLSVGIVPREFTLAFTTSDNEPLETVQVRASATTQVRLSLLGDAPLGEDEMLTVSFVYAAANGGTGADVMVREPVSFTITSGKAIDLMLNAPVAAQPGTLTASIEDAVNAIITPTSLSVEILTRELKLTFTTLDDVPLETARVQAGATTRVRLSLSGDGSLGEDEMLTVSLIYAAVNGGTGADVAVREPVSFTTISGNVIDLTLNALGAARPGTLTASIEDAVNAIITPASLPVEILSREFTLTFTTLDDAPLETARVRAGATMQVRLSLSGDGSLSEDETLAVNFVYETMSGGTGADVTVQEPVSFTAASGTAIDLTLNAVAAARPGTLTATIAGTLPANTLPITSVDLPIEILPRELALTFTAVDGAALETARVPANGTARVRLGLSGDGSLGADETLTVSFVYAAENGSTGADVTVRESVSFTTAIDLTLNAPAAARPGTLTATIVGTLPANTLPITSADLPIEIVPREYALTFTTVDDEPLETARVPANTTTQVRLSLSGATPETLLDADETLTVSFVYAAENGSTDTDVTVLESVNFTATSGTVVDLTLNASAAAQPGTLTAGIEDAVNVIVTPALLPVEILPREFTLTFTTVDDEPLETTRVPAGATTQVRLNLSGATPETLLGTDEMLTVSFVYAAESGGTDTDVTVRESVNFTATSGPLIDLTLSAPRAAQPGTGTLTASIEDAVNAIITPASLSVEIVPSEAIRLQVRVLLEGALQ